MKARRPRSLDAVLESVRRCLCADGISCGRISCAPEGSLRLPLRRAGSDLGLIWQAQATPPGTLRGDLFGWRLTPARRMSGPSFDQASRFVSGRLGPLWRGGLRLFLGRRNRGIVSVPPTPAGLRRLFRGCLEEGSVCWGRFVFRGFARADGALVLPFAHGPSRRRVDFHLRPSGRPPAGEPLWRRTILGPLTVARDERRPEDRRAAEWQVEQALAFWLSRCLHPSMRWAAADAGMPPGTGLKDLLRGPRLPPEEAGRVFFGLWGRGFIGQELVLRSPGLGPVLYHGNRECAPCAPSVRGCRDLHNFSPWPRRSEERGSFRCTDFDDEAALSGGERRLASALRESSLENRGAAVYLSQTCEYACLSEDVEGAAARAAGAHGCDVVPLGIESGPRTALHDGGKWSAVLERLQAGRRRSASPDRRGIGLVGFGPPADALAELEALLSSLGIRVRCRLFPYLERPAGLDKVSLWVASPWAPVRDCLRAASGATGRPVLELPLPFGVDGTRRWLGRLAAALRLPSRSRAGIAAEARRHGALLASASAGASSVRLGFVMPEEHARELSDPAFFYGFDPLPFVRELGFQPVVVRARRGGSSLIGAMRRSRCELFYSDHPFDGRVAAAGAMPFCIRDLEPGFAGAARTARRLLARAAVPFFKRYGRRVPAEGS